jgi:bacterioferritin (cytochrome b1)
MMTLQEMVRSLNNDLGREYMHWHFYMNAAMRIAGLHREEIQEFLLDEAKGEMAHIEQFGRLIVGLGGTPNVAVAPFRSDLVGPKRILEEALRIEDEVVANYVERMDQAVELQNNGGVDKVHGRYIEIFLEDQILDSRKDADHIREMIKGV